MDYITTEQFLEQPKEVQEIFEHWIEKNITETDLFGYIGETPIYKRKYPQIAKNIAFDCISSELVPLFTETQLRHFIEERSGYKICSWTNLDDKYIIDLSKQEVLYKTFKTEQTDLLQAYWIVVCKIACHIVNKI